MSKEYGWTDEEIYNLTVRRFRQVTAAIQRRNYLEERRQKSLVSWQTRAITSFIAGGYMVDGKKGNPALEAANSLSFDEIEKLQLEEAQIAAADKPMEVKKGSYERMMGSLGNPSAWKR